MQRWTAANQSQPHGNHHAASGFTQGMPHEDDDDSTHTASRPARIVAACRRRKQGEPLLNPPATTMHACCSALCHSRGSPPPSHPPTHPPTCEVADAEKVQHGELLHDRHGAPGAQRLQEVHTREFQVIGPKLAAHVQALQPRPALGAQACPELAGGEGGGAQVMARTLEHAHIASRCGECFNMRWSNVACPMHHCHPQWGDPLDRRR